MSDMMKVTKEVSVEIAALNDTATLAHVTEYREAEGIYVYDLYNAQGIMVAKSRYDLVAEAPFELSEADILILNPPPPEIEDELPE